jgi:hypothetical protein
MPSLCIGGLVTHACPAGCVFTHPTADTRDGSCNHETGCEVDLCAIATLRSVELDARCPAPVDLAYAMVVDSPDLLEPNSRIPFQLRPDLRLRVDNLPFPRADIPLLI